MSSLKKQNSLSTRHVPSLREFQQNFVEELRRINKPAKTENWSIIRSDRYSREFRLERYKAAVSLKYLRSIKTTYRCTIAFLSRKKADEIAVNFAERFPSETYEVADTLKKFPAFLQTLAVSKRLRWIVHLAQLESQIAGSRYRKDAIDSEMVGSLSDLRTFSLSRDYSFLVSEWTFFNSKFALLQKPIAKRQYIAIGWDESKMKIRRLTKSEWLWLSEQFSEKFTEILFEAKQGGARIKPQQQKKIYRSLVKKGILVARTRKRL